MWICITFCAVLQLANGEKFGKVLKTEAQNSIIFEKVGTLWANVKYAFLRFDVDMNPMYQTIENCRDEFEQIEKNITDDESNVDFIKTNLDYLVTKMKKAKNIEKKLKNFGGDIPENSVLVNVPKSKSRDTTKLSEPIIVLGMKILDNRFKIDDLLSMIETYVDWECQVVPTFFSRFDRTFDVEAAVSELLEQFKNYEIRSQDGFSFRYIETGRIEIIQKVTLIDGEQIFDLHKRLSIPFVYKNEVLIDLDTKREFAVQEDKQQFVIIPKDFHVYCKYEHRGRRFCTESLQIMDQSEFEKTCYGTLYFQKFENIKENCNFQLNTPEIFAERSGNYEHLVFHPDPEKAGIECNEKQVDDWEKTVELHKFQKLQIPGPCNVLTSKFVLIGSHQDIFKINEKEFTNHILSDADLEKIWPELKNQKVREMIQKDKSTEGNTRIVQTTSNVTINLGINLREEF